MPNQFIYYHIFYRTAVSDIMKSMNIALKINYVPIYCNTYFVIQTQVEEWCLFTDNNSYFVALLLTLFGKLNFKTFNYLCTILSGFGK